MSFSKYGSFGQVKDNCLVDVKDEKTVKKASIIFVLQNNDLAQIVMDYLMRTFVVDVIDLLGSTVFQHIVEIKQPTKIKLPPQHAVKFHSANCEFKVKSVKNLQLTISQVESGNMREPMCDEKELPSPPVVPPPPLYTGKIGGDEMIISIFQKPNEWMISITDFVILGGESLYWKNWGKVAPSVTVQAGPEDLILEIEIYDLYYGWGETRVHWELRNIANHTPHDSWGYPICVLLIYFFVGIFLFLYRLFCCKKIIRS